MALEKSDKKYLNFLISNETNCVHSFNKIFKFIKIESCLIKSVSIFLFLKNNNFKPKLFIGVLMENSEFKSHAWLMIGNKILTEKPENFVNYKIIKTVQ